MSILLKLAWRNIWRNGRRSFITMLSVAVGLACGLFFVSLMRGAQLKMVNDATHLTTGHLTVEHASYRDALDAKYAVPSIQRVQAAAHGIDGIAALKTVVASQALISTASGSEGVSLIGVSPAQERDTSPLVGAVVAGRYLTEEDHDAALVGSQLAERLKLAPGKKLVISLTSLQGQMTEELARVVGVFETGSTEMDGGLVYLPWGFARAALGMSDDQTSQVGFVLAEPEREADVQRALQSALANTELAVRSWREIMPELASWQSLTTQVGRVLTIIIIFLVNFSIVNTMLMSVLERRREFATVLALGTPPRLLRLQVLVESFLLALLGCAVGAVVGGALTYWGQVQGIDLRGFTERGATVGGFAFDLRLRCAPTLEQVIWLALGLITGAVIMNVYAMLRVTRLNVADTLRGR